MENIKTMGYGASGSLIGGETLKPMEFERQAPGTDELLIEVLYCGVCHSDIHQVANDWKNTIYPCVPGHEVVGRVTEAGSAVTRFKVGDLVGVGCMIDSCGHCHSCTSGEEQYCLGPVAMTMTYNGYFKPDGSNFNTFGGYSTNLVVKEDFVLNIPENLEISAVAPILCAGVTTYSPLKRWKVKAGDKVGVVGIGGLGHMAVMIANAMGAEVTAITTKEEKREEALQLGAKNVLISTNEEELEKHARELDYILITIPYPFDINMFVPLVKPHGEIVTVGLLAPYEKPVNNMVLATMNVTVGGSMIGSIQETKEVLEFCSAHQILPDVQMITMDQINDAFDHIKEEDVRFRYVINMASLKA